MRCAIFAFACLSICGAGCRDEKPIRAPDFQTFWSEFRAAVVRDDRLAISELTRFPFEARGSLDDAPKARWERSHFLEQIEPLMLQDAGMSTEAETMRAYVARVHPPVDTGGASVHIGDFLFQRIEGEWRWIGAYVQE